MKGFPKHLNTKADVEYCLIEFPEQTKAYLKTLLDGRFGWITTGKLSDGKQGISDEAHRIAEIKDDRTLVVTERYQEEYKEDPTCKLFRLRLTVAEAKGYLEA